MSIITRYSSCILLLLSVACCFSCKKTPEYAEDVNSQPYLITGSIDLNAIHKGTYAGLQRNVLQGDTLMLVGRLFADKAGFSIHVGDQEASVVEKFQVPNGINAYTQQMDYLDVLRFVITPQMGLGDQVPLHIQSNGMSVQAPPLSIRQFTGDKHRTDTTLSVDLLASWEPTDKDFYIQHFLPPVSSSSVADDGSVLFNNLTGMFLIRNGQVSTVLSPGDKLSENGTTVTIKMIHGSAISIDGSNLFFSAEVIEDTPDTANAYIFRLGKLDLASKNLVTLNRTLVAKHAPVEDEQPGPYEGNVNNLKIAAAQLKLDGNGNLYFRNSYPPAVKGWDAQSRWYANGLAPSYAIDDINTYGNVCRMDSRGQIKSILAPHSSQASFLYNPPGLPVASTADYIISRDGKTAFVSYQMNNNFQVSFGTYDLEHGELQTDLGFRELNFRFISYDDVPATRMQTPEYRTYFYFTANSYLNTYIFTADGDLLSRTNSSIFAFNLFNKTVYCYAGIENNQQPPGQHPATGPVKAIDFAKAEVLFTGMDKKGGIYYYDAYSPFVDKVNFYKLYPQQ